MPSTPVFTAPIRLIAMRLARLTYQMARLTNSDARAHQAALQDGLDAASEVLVALQHDGDRSELMNTIKLSLQELGEQMNAAEESGSTF